MRIDARLVLGLVLGLTFSTDAVSQAGSVNFRIRFAGQVDCDRPISIKNVPLTADVVGVLNPDGTASGELTQTAFVLSSTVRFDGRLGAPLAQAPGGTSQGRVIGPNGLRLIWQLPNNAITVNKSNRMFGRSCVNCHSNVHGSNHPSGQFYMR